MKKKLVVCLIALLMVGCSNKGASGENLLSSIESKKELRVAMSPDYAPYEFIDPTKTGDDRYAGADVELAKYIAHEMGVKLVIAPTSFLDIPGAVSRYISDVGISGFTYEEERTKVIDFSISYDRSEANCQGVIIRKEDEAKYKTLADLKGTKVAAQNGSVQLKHTEGQIEDVTTRLITKIDEGILELEAGNVEAIASACSTAQAIENANSNLVFSELRFEVSGEDGTMVVVPKNEPELLNKINEIITKVNEEGLYTKWMEEALEKAAELGVEME